MVYVIRCKQYHGISGLEFPDSVDGAAKRLTKGCRSLWSSDVLELC